jgi:hypothetical protein
LLKIAERSEAKSVTRRKNQNLSLFNRTLRFALLASLRSAVLNKIKRPTNSCLFSLKMAERYNSKAKKRVAKLCVKMFKILIFDGKLRFTLLASLRSASFSKNKKDN